jgi:hypothetical protein
MLLSSLLILSPISAAPHKAGDIGDAIAFARENKRLILFVLGQSFSKEVEAVQAMLDEELALTGDEFVIVNLKQETAAHRQLFEERLKLETKVLPLAAVTDAVGNLIQSASGTEREDYTKLVALARVKTGLEKDPVKIAALKIDSSETGYINEDGVFAMRKRDVAGSRVAITEVRTWKFRNGSTLLAALLEAKDAIGVFLTPEGKTVEHRFDGLSEADIDFLKQALVSEKAITPTLTPSE